MSIFGGWPPDVDFWGPDPIWVFGGHPRFGDLRWGPIFYPRAHHLVPMVCIPPDTSIPNFLSGIYTRLDRSRARTRPHPSLSCGISRLQGHMIGSRDSESQEEKETLISFHHDLDVLGFRSRPQNPIDLGILIPNSTTSISSSGTVTQQFFGIWYPIFWKKGLPIPLISIGGLIFMFFTDFSIRRSDF